MATQPKQTMATPEPASFSEQSAVDRRIALARDIAIEATSMVSALERRADKAASRIWANTTEIGNDAGLREQVNVDEAELETHVKTAWAELERCREAPEIAQSGMGNAQAAAVAAVRASMVVKRLEQNADIAEGRAEAGL